MQRLLALASTILLSCGGRSSPVAGGDERPAVRAAEGGGAVLDPLSHRRLAMAARAQALGDARDALVRGRLDEARAGMAALAALPTPPQLPAEGAPWLRAIEQAARSGAQAADARSLAVAVAQVANQCGGCHQTVSAPVHLPHPGPVPGVLSGEGGPAGDPGMARHMALQQWALERMWAGLILPSPEAWAESLRAFALVDVDDLRGEVDPAEEARLRAITAAQRARVQAGLSDDNPDTRADLYGTILGACLDCHQGR